MVIQKGSSVENRITYKGYTGEATIDFDAGIIFGRTLTRDSITFQGRSVEEVKENFQRSVDDYLSWAEEDGYTPTPPDPES